MLSPVIMLSSTADLPSTTVPSTGTFSPGETSRRSPTATSSIGTSTSRPSRTTVATFGARPISLLIASLVLPLATASRYFPRTTRVIRTAAVSKYCSVTSPNIAATLYP